ncbi:MAG: DUF1614 domain-containing protein [Candidatus Njordarchaeales archaeon]
MSESRYKKIMYLPFKRKYFFLYLIIYLFMWSFLFLTYGLVFQLGLGLTSWQAFLIILFSLFGSVINIPIYHITSYRPVVKGVVVRLFWIDWVIPEVTWEENRTLIAVNLGGCIIPVALSMYIIYNLVIMEGLFILLSLIGAIVLNSLLIHSVAKPIPGLGIATPTLAPPLFTVLVTYILAPIDIGYNIFGFAYVVGTLGALIGADLMNLRKIPKLGAPIASIGGAGTFDGIFITGLFAIILMLP